MHDAPGKQVSSGTTKCVGCEGSSCVASSVRANEWTLGARGGGGGGGGGGVWGGVVVEGFWSVFLRLQPILCRILSG